MNINRNNYEPFFLLYVDNELSDADKTAVELFLNQNPDLLPEFKALQQTVLIPPVMDYTGKNALLKNDAFAITQHNLLLLLDNELNPVQEKEITERIENDSLANKEWEILQQTKLSSDLSIQLKDKTSLYKKETAKLISFDWKKVAVAAMLLGAGIWVGIKYYTASGNKQGIAATAFPAQMQETALPANLQKTDVATTNPSDQVTQKSMLKERNSTNPNSIVKKENSNNFIAKQNPNQNKPSHLENINNPISNKKILPNVLPKTNDAALAKNNAPVLADKQITIQPDNEIENNSSFAMNASYNEDENDNKILYMDEAQVKRTKLGGLFRKAKRVLERTTHIKTGDGIKLAGFEIALK